MTTKYEVAKLNAPLYEDAPYFIVKSELIKKKRRHTIMAGRYSTPNEAARRIQRLEKNSATT